MTQDNNAQSHYQLLQVKPTASPQEIRRAYRDLSKLYHPDTTTLPPEVATEKFKVLNAAYATLSNPEKRLAYDYSIGISRIAVIQAPSYLNRPASQRKRYEKNSAYLDPTDRPLSPGELFALFILGLTFVGCLVLVVAVGWTKGELVLHPPFSETAAAVEQQDLPAVPDAPLAPYLEPTPELPAQGSERLEPTPATVEAPPASLERSSSESLHPDNLWQKII